MKNFLNALGIVSGIAICMVGMVCLVGRILDLTQNHWYAFPVYILLMIFGWFISEYLSHLKDRNKPFISPTKE